MSFSITSIKLNSNIYNKFKKDALNANITLQEFVNCCLELFINNKSFNTSIHKYILEKQEKEQQKNIKAKNEALKSKSDISVNKDDPFSF